ncbi:MAG TPA: response regulator [Bacteroidales bacterium]|nr:response regulator [Bacteroidales bacterium]HPT12713.1 response regulator [Bacteroidales bacterium]
MIRPKHIFIVDDDPFITRLITKRLSDEGYNISAFAFAEDCITALPDNPDLIILDLYFLKEGFSKMDGMEAFKRIQDYNPDLPVIILSGQEKGELVLELARKGIAGYVIKDQNIIDNLFNSIAEVFNRQ